MIGSTIVGSIPSSIDATDSDIEPSAAVTEVVGVIFIVPYVFDAYPYVFVEVLVDVDPDIDIFATVLL